MAWDALWAGAGIPQVTGNPQGSLAAPVGSIVVRPCDGAVYIKRGGGNTAYGWYLFNSDQFINWQPRWVNAAAQATVNANTQALAVAPGTIINFLPSLSGVGVGDSKRGYVGGYTTAVDGNSFLYRLTNNTDSMPSQRIDGTLADCFQEFDFWWDILTTPRSSSVAAVTDLTTGTMRIWAGGVFGATAIQAVGGTVSSDTLATEWPTALAGTDNHFGFAFRYSSAVDAGVWQFVTTRRAGGVYTQTVTPMSAIAADTAYRLRVRYVLIAGVLTALASINDGTEVAVTTDLPQAEANGLVRPFQPLASVRRITLATKSLAVAQCAMNYGLGVGLTC